MLVQKISSAKYAITIVTARIMMFVIDSPVYAVMADVLMVGEALIVNKVKHVNRFEITLV